MMTEDYLVGNKLRITVDDIDRRRFDVPIEKATGCKACGACTSLYTVGALQVDEDSIFIDLTKCNRYQRYIETQSF